MRLVAGLVMAVVALRACAAPQEQDSAALVALDQAYVSNWARNDADAVLALFADDAVIIPHDGDEPRVGIEAIRDFWFPTGGATVAVETFEHDVRGVSVENGHGVAWGRFELAFTYENARYAYDGNFLMAGRRNGSEWEITHLTWNDPPPTVTPN